MLQNLQLTTQNKILLISVLTFVLLYFILNAKNKAAPLATEKKPLYADTLIPKGQVLVPLNFANIEALASLIDHYGIIDLYTGTENNSVLIASRIKILRAPLNPNQYAVMVTEDLSQEIMKYQGPFLAVVQNRFAQTENPIAKKDTKKLAAGFKERTQGIEIEYYTGAE